MSVTSLPLESLPEIDTPFAVSSVDEIAEDTQQGYLASLIYVEGDYALYLDDEETDLALHDADDRDLAILDSLLELARDRVYRERQIRRRAATAANQLTLA